MIQRREIEARLGLYDELSGIFGAMRGFALAELHRIVRREEAQQQVVAVLKRVLDDVAPFLSRPEASEKSGLPDIWLLLGSVRGFCGSFNEDVMHVWRAHGGCGQPTIAVGERLSTIMPTDAPFLSVEGAESGLDATATIDRIVSTLSVANRQADGQCGIVVCLHEENAVRTKRLLPLPVAAARPDLAPLMNEAPPKLAAKVVENYLFHALLAALLCSIHVENRQRLMQMDNAIRHIEKNSEDLLRQRNRLRQEEIVEEIEIMVGLRGGMR
jgi:F-type H+-transporting ATPase subunit gamma